MTLKSLPNHLSKRVRLDKVIIYLSESKVLIESKKIWYENKHNEILDVDPDIWPNDGEVITETHPECIKYLNEKDKERILCWYWPPNEKLPINLGRGYRKDNRMYLPSIITLEAWFNDNMAKSFKENGYFEISLNNPGY